MVRLVHEEVGEPAWYQAEAIQGEAPQDSPGPNCRIAGEPEVIRISEAARWPSCGAADPCGCQARSGPLGGPTRPHCWRLTARLPSDAACPARPRGRGSGFPPVSSHGSPVSASRARLFPAARSHRGLSGSARVHQEAGTRRRTEAHLRGGGPGPGNHRDYRPRHQSRRPGALFAPPEASAHSTPILPPTTGSTKCAWKKFASSSESVSKAGAARASGRIVAKPEVMPPSRLLSHAPSSARNCPRPAINPSPSVEAAATRQTSASAPGRTQRRSTAGLP